MGINSAATKLGAISGLVAASIGLAACAAPPKTASNDAGDARGFIGGVVAEEPRAATLARDVLAAGGNAADAAVAAYFALAVTYPGAASLGGGGTCLVYDAGTRRAEALVFTPKAAAAGGAVAVPGNVRGFGLLHARYGKLRWEQVLAPAEQIARLGHPVSRAYASALAEASPDLIGAPSMAILARGPSGALWNEGQPWRQVELAATLARLRTMGAGDFYAGQLARAYISGAATVGGKLTVDDMQGYRIDWTGPLRLPFANITLLFPPTRDGGAAASRLWTALARSGGLLSAARLDRDGIVAAMSQTRTGADGGAPVGGLASTGFATIDKDGQAVACAVSMGRPFGLRRTAGMSGIVLARTPGGADDEMPYLSAMIAINSNVHQVLAAVAASGGAVAPAAMVQTAAEALVANNTPARALAAPRLFRAGPAALLLREPGLDSEFVARIEGRGTASAEIGQLGRVGLLFCADGLPRAPASCRFAADPRGFGLAAGG